LLGFVSVFTSVLVDELLISFFVSSVLILVLANENDGLVSPLLVVVSVLLVEKENVGFVVAVAAKLMLANGLLFVVVDVCCVLFLVLPVLDLFAFIISLLFTAAVGTTVAVFSSLLDKASFAFDGASSLILSSSFSLSNSNLRCRCSSHFFCAFCIRVREALHGDEVVVAAVDSVDIDDILIINLFGLSLNYRT